MRLDSSDAERLSEAIGMVSEAQSLAQLPRRVIDATISLVPTTLCGWNEINTQRRRAVIDIAGDAAGDPQNAELMRVFEGLAHQHPLLVRYQETRDGRPWKISDLLNTRDWHQTEIYQRVYSQMGVEDQMVFILPAPETLVVGVAVNRPRRNFSERDRLILNLFRPHVLRAYSTAETVTTLNDCLSAHDRVLEASGEAVLVLGPDDQIIRRSPQSADVLARWFGSGENERRLPDELAAWLQQARSQPLPPAGATHVKAGSGRTLTTRAAFGSDEAVTTALLFRERPDAVDPAALRSLGLTSTEAAVLAHVASGRSTREIADALEMSARTVTKHLEHVFQKLGVTSRVAATAVAIEAAARAPSA